MINRRTTRIISAIGLIFWMGKVAVAATDTTAILYHGNPSNRVNIVFVGDGYQRSEITQYAKKVGQIVNDIFLQTPFRQYKRYFNVYRTDIISNQSGSDHPDTGRYVDTALDSYYDCNGQQRLICVDPGKVYDAVASAPVAADIIFVVVNDSEYGGSGGLFSVFSTHTAASELALHELGHSFGRLADEYFSPMQSYSGPEPSAPNLTTENDWANIKWNHWIDAFTPIPTTQATLGVPGLYEGGLYHEFNIYRPTANSKMRTLNMPFESINAEQLVLRTYDRVSPIDRTIPADPIVTIPPGHKQTFSVSPMRPSHPGMSVRWFLDDIPVGEDSSLSLYPSDLATGINLLRVEVRDASPLVRHDPTNLLMDLSQWTVTNGPVIAFLPNRNLLEGQQVQFDVRVTDATPVSLSAQLSNGQALSTIGATFVDHGNSTATFSWIPTDGQGGRDYLIKISARDQHDLVDIATPRLTVQSLVAYMVNPKPGSILSGSTVRFEWSGHRPSAWWLDIGSQLGAADYFDSGPLGGNRSTTVTTLPTDGSTVYLRLWYFVSGKWLNTDFQYQAAKFG